MTLEEGIKRTEEKKDHYYKLLDIYRMVDNNGIYLNEAEQARNSAEEQEQIETWLKQLKQIKELTDLFETTMDWGCNDEVKCSFANAIYACINPEKEYFQHCIGDFIKEIV